MLRASAATVLPVGSKGRGPLQPRQRAFSPLDTLFAIEWSSLSEVYRVGVGANLM